MKTKTSFELLLWISSCFSNKNQEQQEEEDTSVFLYCELQFDINKWGWLKSASRVQHIRGVRDFRMDNKGNVQVSGIFDPDIILHIVKRYAEIKLLQAGLCFNHLYPPQQPKKETKNIQVANHPPYHGYNGDYQGGQGGYGYNRGYGRYPNYNSQPQIFGNNQIMQKEEQPVVQAKKTEPSSDSQGGNGKAQDKNVQGVTCNGGGCTM